MQTSSIFIPWSIDAKGIIPASLYHRNGTLIAIDPFGGYVNIDADEYNLKHYRVTIETPGGAEPKQYNMLAIGEAEARTFAIQMFKNSGRTEWSAISISCTDDRQHA